MENRPAAAGSGRVACHGHPLTLTQHPLWLKELYGFKDHVPETEEYGIHSFVYRARRPFDPKRFNTFIGKTWPGLIRAKGHFWLATRPDWVGEFSLAGAMARVTPLGYWWVAVPKHVLADRGIEDLTRNPHWDAVWGDRRQELVFIGTDMDEGAIRAELDRCLIQDKIDHFDPKAFRRLPDPFPQWGSSRAA